MLAVLTFSAVNCFTLQQLKDGSASARDCMIKIGINPFTVKKLSQGDVSNDDEKSQVSELHKSSDQLLRQVISC